MPPKSTHTTSRTVIVATLIIAILMMMSFYSGLAVVLVSAIAPPGEEVSFGGDRITTFADVFSPVRSLIYLIIATALSIATWKAVDAFAD